MCKDIKEVKTKNSKGSTKQEVVLHDNARPHTGRCTRKAIATMEWLFSLVIPSLDLASFGFNSFEP
jgi:hypothetical protein